MSPSEITKQEIKDDPVPGVNIIARAERVFNDPRDGTLIFNSVELQTVADPHEEPSHVAADLAKQANQALADQRVEFLKALKAERKQELVVFLTRRIEGLIGHRDRLWKQLHPETAPQPAQSFGLAASQPEVSAHPVGYREPD